VEGTEDGNVARLRWIALLATTALALVACSGSGSGSGGAGQASATVAPAASAGGGGGYSRGDYGVGGSSSAPGSTAPGTVQLSGFTFVPAALTVAAGSTLSFVNADSVDHAVVEGENGAPAAGQSPLTVSPGKSVSLPIATAGTVRVTCTIHRSMNLTLTVTP
jgi:plastocyanin